jgi:hypothetical protein
VTPHSTASLCPYCDAELFPPARRPASAAGEDEGAAGEIDAEAA